MIIYLLAIILAIVALLKLFSERYQQNNNSCLSSYEIPNLWRFKKNEDLCSQWLDYDKSTDADVINDEMTTCLECHDQSCDRHDPEFAVHEKPWKHLLIDENINNKLEDLFDSLLHKYTSSWIDNVTCNKNLILNKFRWLIRLVTAALVLRFKRRIRLNEFILNQIPSHLFQHLEMYIHGKRKAKSAHFLEESVLKQYGSLIHPAVLNQDNELKYFKSISDLLIETTIPPKYLKCEVSKSFLNEFISCCIITPLVDILTDPDKINVILVYLLHENNNPNDQDICLGSITANAKKKVCFLQNFTQSYKSDKQSLNYFGIKMKQILQDEHLLLLFSRFAKEEYFLNYLQFAMHMDSFLTKITNPDLTQKQLKDLHQSLKNIYNLYFVENSKDYIQFKDSSIRQDFQLVIEGNYSGVQQFRNCKSLYEAYEYVNEVLDYYSQKFFETDVYLSLICGERRSSMDMNENKEYDTEDTDWTKQSINSDRLEIIVDDFDDDSSINEDLDNWSISIPHVRSKVDEQNSNRENLYFEIHVKKSGSFDGESLMIIERQFNEFYILESKLKEFHGDELDEISLPTKKSFLRITKQLLENHREEFENFLRQLLSNTSMKRSKLFYNFLNSNTDSFTGNFNLGKMIRNVPSKFSKEKGQHLYSFLKNFINSSEKDSFSSPTSSPTKNSEANNNNRNDENIKSVKTRRKSSIIQWPSLDMDTILNNTSNNNIDQHAPFQYLYDYLLAALIRFYKLNNRIKQFFFAIRPLIRQTFQGFCDYHLCNKLQQTFTPQLIGEMIDYFKTTLTSNHINKIDKSRKNFPMNLTKAQRSELALNLFKEMIPKWLLKSFIDDYNQHEQIVFLIFSLLQYRLLNKQLLYLLMDLLFAELFPKRLLEAMESKSKSKEC